MLQVIILWLFIQVIPWLKVTNKNNVDVNHWTTPVSNKFKYIYGIFTRISRFLLMINVVYRYISHTKTTCLFQVSLKNTFGTPFTPNPPPFRTIMGGHSPMPDPWDDGIFTYIYQQKSTKCIYLDLPKGAE